MLLRAGVRRLMLGNEIGGLASGARLGQLLAAYPDARLLAFADSADTVRALAAAAGEAGRPVDVLVEVGAAAPARDAAGVRAILDAVQAQGGKLSLAGVATHEGAVASSDPEATRRNIAALMARAIDALHQVARWRRPRRWSSPPAARPSSTRSRRRWNPHCARTATRCCVQRRHLLP